MKYTFATIAAFASVALAQPAFLNSKFDVEEGKPFTIKYSGCEGGCTITLQNGKSTDTKDVEVLTATAEGDSFTFTPGNLPSDTYNFKIKNNEDGTVNYSGQFAYEGTGTLPSKTEAETSAAETSAAETTSAEETSAPATTEATTLTTISKPVSTKEKTTTEEHTTIHTPIATKNATTPIPTTKKATSTGASSTEGSESTAAETSAAATGSATTVPESGAARMTSSLALIAGAVMAMVYLN
ncbi:GPI-anchored domain-containing protein [Fusarium sp. LHS14.1]|nr:GPI-anchored domain-containing protein [Fusarium sp. LHS14.1]